MRDASLGVMSNAIVIRRYAVTLSGSVVEQIKWAISALGQAHLWEIPKAKLEFTYLPTGQKILFKGADNEEKLKSSKVSVGYFKYIWYEELTEFEGMHKIRSINQSLMRGGQYFTIVYTYNPPKSVRSWVNQEIDVVHEDKKKKHTTYLTVPRKWLGEPFIIEAEHLKKTNYSAYEHEYLGEVTGTGGEVFKNIETRAISDEEISRFTLIREGIDYGYASDPFAWVQGAYDRKRRTLYLFDEIYKVGLSNLKAAKMMKKRTKAKFIIAESAEPKSNAFMNEVGLRVIGAKKGPGSVDFGMKFLEDLEKIVIDPIRCPNTNKEFTNYELERDKDGNLRADYPDKNNHAIDAVRYMLEYDMGTKGSLNTLNKRDLGI